MGEPVRCPYSYLWFQKGKIESYKLGIDIDEPQLFVTTIAVGKERF